MGWLDLLHLQTVDTRSHNTATLRDYCINPNAEDIPSQEEWIASLPSGGPTADDYRNAATISSFTCDYQISYTLRE